MRAGWWRCFSVMVVLCCGSAGTASAACAASPAVLLPLAGELAASSSGAITSAGPLAGAAQSSLSAIDPLLQEGRYTLALETLAALPPALRDSPEFVIRAASAYFGLGAFEEAAKRLDALPPDALVGQTRVAWLIERGNVEVELDQLRQGRARFARARDLAAQSQWPSLEARARLNGLRAQIDDRDIVGITEQIESIRNLLERIPAPDDRARLSISLAELARRSVQELRGDVVLRGVAFALLTDARARASDPGTQGFAAGLIGALYEDEGRLPEALTYTQQARFLAQQTQAREQLYRWEWQSGVSGHSIFPSSGHRKFPTHHRRGAGDGRGRTTDRAI